MKLFMRKAAQLLRARADFLCGLGIFILACIAGCMGHVFGGSIFPNGLLCAIDITSSVTLALFAIIQMEENERLRRLRAHPPPGPEQ